MGEHRLKSLGPAGLAIGALLFASAGFVAGALLATNSMLGAVGIAPPGAPEGVDFTPVWKAWRVIDEKFVPAAVATTTSAATTTADLNQERVWGLISGLSASLNDPYTFFLPPSENKEFAADMSGSFEGVGMEIDVKDGVLTVVSPLKGTPADKAGIKSGDRILKIDGADTAGIDTGSAVRLIRGPKGTQVALTILRDGWGTPREIKVTRDVINVPIVTTEQKDGGVFVITIASFTSNSPQLFRSALREFVESGNTKLVLDLRGNPGGYLDAAVDIASWFLPAGKTVVTEDYDGHAGNIIHRSLGYDIFNDNLRMVILVDRGSASASEILADALRYWEKAILVGVETFGKGSVQELVDITPETALKLTVARWLGPDGTQIPLSGIVPDVKVEYTDEDAAADRDPQMDKALELLSM
ncbi:MAG: S41 family peptidase [Patescibacteria group bacterium]|nr:S41 family peptidase [Patescibacteria group bacterium]